MRKRAHLTERIENLNSLMVYTKEEIDAFRGDGKLYLEIGCGKGKFIRECALRDEGIPHLAVEDFVRSTI